MRFLFIGDIVGPPGLSLVRGAVPRLRATERLDLVIANAENGTNGSGLIPRDYRHLRSAGIDAITLGDHIYKKLDITDVLTNPTEPICKPANYPTAAPGRDHVLLTVHGVQVVVISLIGRTFMKPVDCPFAAIDRLLASLPPSVVIVDFHAEATGEKYLMARHLDGRVTALLGTHTHVPTADEQVLRGGTAFICDAGMTGPYESVLGRRADRILHTTLTFEPTPFDVATEDVRLAGVIVDVDTATRRATAIRRVMIKDEKHGHD